MWTDNETSNDLLGFSVHADLILSVVTNPKLLPVVMGVFGDWGSGKSSIMKMLEAKLAANEYKEVACLYFNGWLFEGYQDAKSALLSSILLQLAEHERFGPKLKKKALALLKRVKWMEVAKLGVKHVGVPLLAGLLSGGAGAIPALLASLPIGESVDKSEGGAKVLADIPWADLINTDSDKPDVLAIRKFRDDFESMLKETKIDSLVILIDDLDRCLPDRIIDTLEAIKLFVAVPNTAFVIGADPRIVRHAIATRYVDPQLQDSSATDQDHYDLIKDYLEKLIQLPYHLPRLSPAEIETYVNLLACKQYLDDDDFGQLSKKWSERRIENFYAAFTRSDIALALKGKKLPDDLEQYLGWSQSIAQVLTEGLKGNPRQIKRMLNAMILRQKLAKVAKISIRDEVLAKLMVLEYAHGERFRELNDWQGSENGFPAILRGLEEHVRASDDDDQVPDRLPKEWLKLSVRKWLRIDPPLQEVDLRDYFWLARDRTSSTLANVTLVAPIVRKLCDQLLSTNKGVQNIAVREAAKLSEADAEQLLGLLHQRVERQPSEEATLNVFRRLIEGGMSGANTSFLSSVRKAAAGKLPPGLAYILQGLAKAGQIQKDEAFGLLEKFRTSVKTPLARASEAVLKDWK